MAHLSDMPALAVNVETPSTAAAAGVITFDGTTQFNGTRHFAPATGVVTDYSSKMRSLTIQRGSHTPSDALFHAQAGTATVTFDNRTRIFDPLSNSDIAPGRTFGVTATWNAVTYPLYQGYAKTWSLTYPTKWAGKGDAVTQLDAADWVSRLAAVNVTDSLPSQLTGDRVNALCEVGQVPRTLRAIDPGLSMMPSMQQTTSAWPAFQEAADSEFGEIYVDASGLVTFRDRNAIITESRSNTSQATWGDSGSELRYEDVEVSYDDERIRTDVQVTYDENNSTVTVSDPVQIGHFGRRSYPLQVKLTNKAVALNLANLILELYAKPYVRVDRITIKPRRDPTNLWPQVLGRELGDLITVNVTPPGGGSRISQPVVIRGITHTVTTEDWTTVFDLQNQLFIASDYIKFDGTTQFNGTKKFWF